VSRRFSRGKLTTRVDYGRGGVYASSFSLCVGKAGDPRKFGKNGDAPS